MSAIARHLKTLLAALAMFVGLAANADAAERPPAELRIGFQKSSINLLIVKQLGLLEKRFPGAKVTWIEFPAGPQLLEALSVGSLDFGMTGDSPPVFAQAAGKDLLYVGAEAPKPENSAILVPANSGLRTLADLKGKRVALQKGSSAHFVVVQALKKAGLKWADIEPIYLTPADARAAFERGSVDAWAIWDPYYAAAELAIKPRVLSTGKGLSSNNTFYLAASNFARQQPAAVLALLEALSQAEVWTQAHKQEAAQTYSKVTGLDLPTSQRFVDRRPSTDVKPLVAAQVVEQQQVADAFLELGLIPRAIRVGDIVWQAPATVAAQ